MLAVMELFLCQAALLHRCTRRQVSSNLPASRSDGVRQVNISDSSDIQAVQTYIQAVNSDRHTDIQYIQAVSLDRQAGSSDRHRQSVQTDRQTIQTDRKTEQLVARCERRVRNAVCYAAIQRSLAPTWPQGHCCAYRSTASGFITTQISIHMHACACVCLSAPAFSCWTRPPPPYVLPQLLSDKLKLLQGHTLVFAYR